MSNEPTIDEMNSTIARFMGITPVPAGTKRLGDIKPPHESIVFLNYHEKWELLMPVVEKIVKLGFFVRWSSHPKSGHSVIIVKETPPSNDDNKIAHSYGCANIIDSLYAAVFQFITWLNQQSTTNGAEADKV